MHQKDMGYMRPWCEVVRFGALCAGAARYLVSRCPPPQGQPDWYLDAESAMFLCFHLTKFISRCHWGNYYFSFRGVDRDGATDGTGRLCNPAESPCEVPGEGEGGREWRATLWGEGGQIAAYQYYCVHTCEENGGTGRYEVH